MSRSFPFTSPSQRLPDPRSRCWTSASWRCACSPAPSSSWPPAALGRGAGVVRRRALPAVERHPQQPHPALGRDSGARQHLPRSRPTTPTAWRATARAACSPANTAPAASPAPSTTAHHRAGRPLRGQAAELAQRHRLRTATAASGSPTRPSASAAGGKARPPRRNCRTASTASTRPAAAGLVLDDLAGPNGLAFSPDERVLYVVESRATPHR
jgi:hypothetical protein